MKYVQQQSIYLKLNWIDYGASSSLYLIFIQMNNRNYCCYRHFKQGKHHKSCTYCNDHVLLGVINPPQKQQTNIPVKQNLDFDIRSKPFRIQNRTHDLNEIQNRDSLPERLTKPKIYIEKIVPKGEKKQILLPPRLSGSSQYQQTVKLFRKVAESLEKKTKAELTSVIRNYSFERKIIKTAKQSVFFTKSQFLEFAMSTFKNLTSQDTELFWNISYNQMRFREKISMEAFVFNFGKFYLQMENFNNMFSEAALRQRMIDLRYLLFDWANSYSALQYNIRGMSPRIKQIQSFLKMSQFQSTYCDLQIACQTAKVNQLKMRSITQMIFSLTDRKFFPSKEIKQSIYESIFRDNNLISTMRALLTQFFDMNDFGLHEKFPITDILTFANTEKYSEDKIDNVVRWTQQFFAFAYFQKWQSQMGIYFNTNTKKLNCKSLLMIDSQMVKQFDRYLLENYQGKVQISKILYSIIEDGLEKMPNIEGKKKKIVEWNYMSEVLLRYVRSVDLTPFWKVYKAFSQSSEEISLDLLQQRLKQTPSTEELRMCMKRLFNYDFSKGQKNIEKKRDRESELSNEEKNDALENVISLKQNPLVLRTRTQLQKPQSNQKGSHLIRQKSMKSESQKNIQNISDLKKDSAKEKIEEEIKLDAMQVSINNYLCPHFYKYSLDISRQTNQTISSVETLQSRVFELLNLGVGQQHQYKF